MATPAQADFVKWFDEIEGVFPAIPIRNNGMMTFPDEQAARAVIAEAATALASVFPEQHALRLAWNAQLSKTIPNLTVTPLFGLRGTFQGAAKLVRDGRLGTLIDQIRPSPRAICSVKRRNC